MSYFIPCTNENSETECVACGSSGGYKSLGVCMSDCKDPTKFSCNSGMGIKSCDYVKRECHLYRSSKPETKDERCSILLKGRTSTIGI